MSNVTVQRLGEEAQRDNAPHRLDYIRQDLHDPSPSRTRYKAGEVLSYGAVFGGLWLIALLVVWAVYGISSYGISRYEWTAALWIFYGLALLTTAAPVLAAVGYAAVSLWGNALRTRSEAARAACTRDRFSNPVSAFGVLSQGAAREWAALELATQSEILMAPYKTLPAGLDAYSVSNSVSGAGAGAPLLTDGGMPAMPAEEWLAWLETRPHTLLSAETGGGKSTTAKSILARRIAGGEQVLVVDPHSSEWLGLASVGGGEDWRAVAAALEAVGAEYRRRLEARDRHKAETGTELDKAAFPRLTVCLDEANTACLALGGKKDGSPWQRFAQLLGSGARKVHISIVLLCQSSNVEDLALSGPMRQNFTRIALDDRTARLMVTQEETNPERRRALLAALQGRQYPAVAVQNGEVILLDRTGLDRIERPSNPERAQWAEGYGTVNGRPPVGLSNEEGASAALLEGLLLNSPANRRADPTAEVLEKLKAYRKAGIGRERVREMGLVFDNRLWTAAADV